ncbi:acyl-CoA dehydrogenase family protein [Saccharomonospora xinjiangensis]|uniref:acyl-CoA dehydrogenase family protein n=1 Tax=Saccharomonospora xinjiangensis TaxID=75294 RepID=UPI003510A412
MTDMVERAMRIADEVLAPAADEVDRTGTIPGSHFDCLAEGGFYGLVAPPEFGGAGVEFGDFLRIIEVLAAGCVTTTFTWLQHHGIVMGLATTPNVELREKCLRQAADGTLRGGGAFSGVIPVPPRVVATRTGDGWSFDGEVTFVSGWGYVDVLHVSAFDPDSGQVVSGLVDAKPGKGIAAVHPLELVAAQGSNTVRLVFDNLLVPDERVTTRIDREEFLDGLVVGLRVDSSLAFGLIDRAARGIAGLGETAVAGALRAEATELRNRFDAALADPPALPALRAETSELAARACSAYVVAAGGRALVRGHEAQRLARESLFTLVVASRPSVKAALLERLADHADAAGGA